MGLDSLTKTQFRIVHQLRQGAVIGELSDKINGRYELFVRKSNWFPKTCHYLEHPFILKCINKNTVFALLALDLIEEDDITKSSMLPFCRDKWYVYKGRRVDGS